MASVKINILDFITGKIGRVLTVLRSLKNIGNQIKTMTFHEIRILNQYFLFFIQISISIDDDVYAMLSGVMLH